MQIIYECCASVDVHKKTAVSCRMKSEGSGPSHRETKTFSTMTRDLLALSLPVQTADRRLAPGVGVHPRCHGEHR